MREDTDLKGSDSSDHSVYFLFCGPSIDFGGNTILCAYRIHTNGWFAACKNIDPHVKKKQIINRQNLVCEILLGNSGGS